MFGFFNNHFHGYAPENCIQILRMLGIHDQEKARALRRIEGFRRQATREATTLRALTLEDFGGKAMGDDRVETLLGAFMDANRLERAKRIDPGEVRIDREGTTVLARIRAYRVEFDPGERRILHDCEDWSAVAPRKDFCKHLGRFFLSLPRAEAVRHLEAIRAARDAWRLVAPTT